jgi:hypothetical protein
MSRVSMVESRRSNGCVTELGPGVFGVETAELATSTRPTKREIPALTQHVAEPPAPRGQCSNRVGKQQANEVHGEIAVPNPT